MRDIETAAHNVFEGMSNIQWSITGEGAQRSIEVIDNPSRLAKLTIHVMQPKMIEETLPSHLVISIEALVSPEAPLSPAHSAALIRHLKAQLTYWMIAEHSVSWHVHRRERAVRLSEPLNIDLKALAPLVEKGVKLILSLVDESKDIAREEAEYFKAHALWGEAERAYRLWHLLDPSDQRVINALMKQLHSERRWGECVRFLSAASEKTSPDRRAQLAFAAAVIAEECLSDHTGALSYLNKALSFDPEHKAAGLRRRRLSQMGMRPRELTRPVEPAPFPSIDESSDYSVIPSQVPPPEDVISPADDHSDAEHLSLEAKDDLDLRHEADPELDLESELDLGLGSELPSEPTHDEAQDELSLKSSAERGEELLELGDDFDFDVEESQPVEPMVGDEDLFSELLSEEPIEGVGLLADLNTVGPSVRPAEELTTAPGSVALPDLEEDDPLEDFFEGLDEEPVALPSRPPVAEPSAFVEPPQPFEVSKSLPAQEDESPLDELEMDLGLLDLGELSRQPQEDALSPDSIDEALTQLPPTTYLSDQLESEAEQQAAPELNQQAQPGPKPQAGKKSNSKGRKRNKKGKKKGKRK